jgi:hypothetical protein
MKTLISYVAVTIFVLASSFTIDVQQNLNHKTTYNCFNYLRGHRQGKSGVNLSWAVNDPSIDHFTIEQFFEGDDYAYPVGSEVKFNGSSTYKVVLTDVFPGNITYRVTAVRADGTSECSPLEQVRIVQRK